MGPCQTRREKNFIQCSTHTYTLQKEKQSWHKQTCKISTLAKRCSRSEDYGDAKTWILFSPLLRPEREYREMRWAQVRSWRTMLGNMGFIWIIMECIESLKQRNEITWMVFQTFSHNSEAVLERPRNGKSREWDHDNIMEKERWLV